MTTENYGDVEAQNFTDKINEVINIVEEDEAIGFVYFHDDVCLIRGSMDYKRELADHPKAAGFTVTIE